VLLKGSQDMTDGQQVTAVPTKVQARDKVGNGENSKPSANLLTAANRVFVLLLAIGLSACTNAQPDAPSSSQVPTSALTTGEIYAPACRPEWCYRSLGEVRYAETLSQAGADLRYIDATENLKRVALEKYSDRPDAIIKLHAMKDAAHARMVVSGEAVQFEQQTSLSCVLQKLGSAIFNLSCDSSREGMVGDAAEYERLYESLP